MLTGLTQVNTVKWTLRLFRWSRIPMCGSEVARSAGSSRVFPPLPLSEDRGRDILRNVVIFYVLRVPKTFLKIGNR
jgi:hypothetical protein